MSHTEQEAREGEAERCRSSTLSSRLCVFKGRFTKEMSARAAAHDICWLQLLQGENSAAFLCH